MKSLNCRLLGVLRLVGMLCLLQLGAALFLAHQARASAEQALDRAGSWLSELAVSNSNIANNTPTPLWLNGLRIWLASGHTDAPPATLLDALESYCNGKTGISVPVEVLKQINKEQPSLGAPNRYGVFRIQNAERGIVACLDGKGATLDTAAFAERARKFLDTGDLAAFGELRYFLVLPGDHGGSTFLSAWTQGSAKLLQLFPEQGDAPGEDLPSAPRPTASHRQLSAGIPGKGRLASYTGAVSADSAFANYREQLIAAGWKIRPVEAPRSLMALLGPRTILVTADDAEGSNQGRITLSEL